MTNDHFDPIETSGGLQPRSSVGERGVVGLALLALGAGLLIAVGNLLGSASPTPSPSPVAQVTPRPTPRVTPQPTLAEVVLQPGTLPPSELQPYAFSGWIRTTTQIATRDAPNLDAVAAEVLAEGAVAWADEQTDFPGWLHVGTATGELWIEPGIALSAQVERIGQPAFWASGAALGLTAGAEGFLAIIVPAGMSDRDRGSIVVFSADGVRWEPTNLPRSSLISVAWGPAGWLALAVDYASNVPGIGVWRSPDGLRWDSLGTAPDGFGGGSPGLLIASDGAYLVTTYGRGFGQSTLWASADGVTWRQTERPPRIGDPGSARLVGLPSGFYVWDPSARGVGLGAFSADGRHWSSVAGGPIGDSVYVGQIGGRVLALATDPDTGAVRSYTGAVVRSALAWDPPSGKPWSEATADTGLSTLVTDGRRGVAVGWDRATDAVLAWDSLDGEVWTRMRLPAGGFGVIPRQAAVGPTGAVIIGNRQTLRGENPIFWHQSPLIICGTSAEETPRCSAGAPWAPEPSPLLEVVADPSPAECGPPPRTGLDFVTLDRALAVVCFGDTPITLQAWSVGCEGCYGASDGTYQPGWLATPGSNQLFLAPITGFSSMPVVMSPALADLPDPTWAPRLVEVTGHFDDPAAASCHWTPAPSQESYYSGQRWVIDGCRQQFVVTAVTVLQSP